MPDLGVLYVPGLDVAVDYGQYGSQDIGFLYDPNTQQYYSAADYMDPVYIQQVLNITQDVFAPSVPLTVEPVQTTLPGPADIFSTLPPLFVTTDPTQPNTIQSTVDTTSTTTAGSGVIVNINNAINTVNKIGDQIGSIISQGIQDGADVAAQTAKDSAVAVTNAVGVLSNNILSAVQSGLQTIWDALKKVADFVANNAGSIIDFLGKHLADIGHAIANDLVPIITSISKVVDTVSKQIQDINDTLIQPIANTINGTITTITSLTKAIETDLHDGLKGLLQIPTDVSNAMSTLDATMQRTVEQLGANNRETADHVINAGFHNEVGMHLDSLQALLTGQVHSVFAPTTFADKVTLPEPGPSDIGGEVITAAWAAIKDFVGAFMHGGKNVVEEISQGVPGFGLAGLDLVQLPITLTVIILTALAELKPITEWMEEDAAAKFGLSKLAPNDALQAWFRGFISVENLRAELGAQGWDAERIQVMIDLQVQMIDVASALDMFYRGIITQDDLTANLNAHGFLPSDHNALILAAQRVLSPEIALTLWKRNGLTDDELKTVLGINRYTLEETLAILDTTLRPETSDETVTRSKWAGLLSSHLTSDPRITEIPPTITAAARAEGLSVEVAEDRWHASFAVPGLQHWLTLFYRGIRTRTELNFAMDYWHIPQDWRDDYIQTSRPLIPFRTIPAMLAAGIIDEGYAKAQLQSHGFDLTATNALLDYAQSKVKTKPAVVANDLHALSLQTARQFWNDGALTDTQYHDLLLAHGYSEDLAALTIHAETMAHAAAVRKSQALDIIDEALAGLITDDQAVQQLSNNNYTVAEMGKYLKQLRSSRRRTSKLPSEAMLEKMFKLAVIDEVTYRNTLGAIGYATNWVDAIFNVNFQAPPPTPAGA